MEEVLIPFIIFGSTAIVLWKFFDGRHRERMSMIEKGVNPSEFKGMSIREMFRTSPLTSLKWGLLALGVGIGLFVAAYLDGVLRMPDGVYPASMLVCGGLALVLYYFIASRKMEI